MIRLARIGEVGDLQDVEVAAGALFRTVEGMAAVADDDPPTSDELAAFIRAEQAWVAVGTDDRPVGYLLLSVVDGAAHVEQVSVHPGHARRGIGRALMGTAIGWARSRGFAAVTLTTFADVAWNAPYYRKLGFSELDRAVLGEELAHLRSEEAARGLDRWPRVAMSRSLAD